MALMVPLSSFWSANANMEENIPDQRLIECHRLRGRLKNEQGLPHTLSGSRFTAPKPPWPLSPALRKCWQTIILKTPKPGYSAQFCVKRLSATYSLRLGSDVKSGRMCASEVPIRHVAVMSYTSTAVVAK